MMGASYNADVLIMSSGIIGNTIASIELNK
jgi:hypothetical protein